MTKGTAEPYRCSLHRPRQPQSRRRSPEDFQGSVFKDSKPDSEVNLAKPAFRSSTQTTIDANLARWLPGAYR
jgi:hypothetical protein